MPPNNSKTLTPTERLDQAMLGLIRVGVPFLNEEVTSSTPSEPIKTELSEVDIMRAEIVAETIARHPGLTAEKALQGMTEMGF